MSSSKMMSTKPFKFCTLSFFLDRSSRHNLEERPSTSPSLDGPKYDLNYGQSKLKRAGHEYSFGNFNRMTNPRILIIVLMIKGRKNSAYF